MVNMEQSQSFFMREAPTCNIKLGPRLGQKSLDLRSQVFCPPTWNSWWVNCAIPTAHVVSLYNTQCCHVHTATSTAVLLLPEMILKVTWSGIYASEISCICTFYHIFVLWIMAEVEHEPDKKFIYFFRLFFLISVVLCLGACKYPRIYMKTEFPKQTSAQPQALTQKSALIWVLEPIAALTPALALTLHQRNAYVWIHYILLVEYKSTLRWRRCQRQNNAHMRM